MSKTNETPDKPRSRLMGLLFGLGVTVALFAVVEILFIVTGAFAKQQHVIEFDVIKSMPRMRYGVLLKEGKRYFINAHGLRGKLVPFEKPAGVYRILCVGDSSVFGDLVPFKEAFPARIEAQLNGRGVGRRVQVVNGGVPGLSSHMIIQFLKEKGLKYKPDLVVLYVLNSEILLGPVPDKRLAPPAGLARAYNFALRSRVVRGLREGLKKTVFAARWKGKLVPRVSRKDMIANVRRIVGMSRALGASVLLLVPPIKEGLDKVESQVRRGTFVKVAGDSTRYQAALRKVAGKLGVPVVDVDALFKEGGKAPKKKYFADEVHPSSLGHKAIADATVRHLLKTGLP